MYVGVPSELGKMALGLLFRIMSMVLLGFSFQIGPSVQLLSYLRVICDFVFVRFCFGSSYVVLSWHCESVYKVGVLSRAF